MKTTIWSVLFFGLLSASHTAFAQDPNAGLPICAEENPTFPCRIKNSEAAGMLVDMMIGNRQGMATIYKKSPGQKKGLTDGYITEDVRVSWLVDETIDPKKNKGYTYRSVMRYEVLLNDCRGTDACNGTYLWTALEETLSDGYTYESKYTNSLAETQINGFEADQE